MLLQLLAKLSASLGNLFGATEIVPDPDLFVRMYVREAFYPARFEGTQASLNGRLEYRQSVHR